MLKATITELVHNAAIHCADVQIAVLTDRVENKKQSKK
jgi:hypothetical protein